MTNAVNPLMYLVSFPFTPSSVRLPSSSNLPVAPDTHINRPDHTCVPRTRNTGSHAYWEKAVPKLPGVAPISPTGRSPKIRVRSFGGRVNQSNAFLKTPGIELLFSGVTIKRPSADAIRFFRSSTTVGTPSASSTSALYKGMPAMEPILSEQPSGTASRDARKSPELKECKTT